MPRRLRILISAYAYNPVRGSEEGVGRVNAVAKFSGVSVIVGETEKVDIEKAISKDPLKYAGIEFYYIPNMRWRRLEKIGLPSYLWTYRLWQKKAYRLAIELN
jgi:hypothetical protein